MRKKQEDGKMDKVLVRALKTDTMFTKIAIKLLPNKLLQRYNLVKALSPDTLNDESIESINEEVKTMLEKSWGLGDNESVINEKTKTIDDESISEETRAIFGRLASSARNGKSMGKSLKKRKGKRIDKSLKIR